MIIFSFFLIILCGFFFLTFSFKDGNRILKIGLSFPLGIGFTSFFMFILDVINSKIVLSKIVIFNIVLLIILLIINYKEILASLKSIKLKINIAKPDYKQVNIFWIFLLLITLIPVLTNVARNLYWPVYIYDSVAGYDLSAKVIAAEGKIAHSLFAYGINLTRGIYPPLSSTSFAIPYMLGMTSSKIILSFFFCSLLLAFYGFLIGYANKVSSLFFTFLLALTPELFGYTLLSNTNFPGVIYIGIGILLFTKWYEDRKISYLIISGMMLGLNVWLRSDGIVFNITIFLVMIYDLLRTRKVKPIIIISLLMFTPFIVWNLYLKLKLGIESDRFVDKLFWDWYRIRLMWAWLMSILPSVKLWGINVILFVLVLILDYKKLKSKKAILPIIIFTSLILYLFVYYHLDPIKQDPISSMMKNSFKRGYMVYMPLFLFYVADRSIITRFFDFVHSISVQKKEG